MPRLHILSDLHLEQAPFAREAVDADVVVLAGDIGSGTAGVAWAREWAAGRPILYLAGNHEYYGHALPGLDEELKAAAAGSTVHVLQDGELILDGVRYLGATLWSDFGFDGPEERERAMGICERMVNDYRQISFGPQRRRLAAADTLAVHERSRRWLEARLSVSHPGPTVVVTHHAPLIRARPPLPIMRAIAGAFASDLESLMGGDRVALWIYGHTHRIADLEVGGTRVVSNPRGYPHQLVAGFDPALVVEV